MTARGFYTLLFGAVMLATALSVGSAGAFLLGAAALIVCLLSLASVLLAACTCRLDQRVDGREAERGGVCRYTLFVSLFSPLPVAPLALRVATPGGRTSDFLLAARLLGQTECEHEFRCPHVGVFEVGLLRVTLSDVFGLFAFARSARLSPVSVAVLPVPRRVKPLPTSPGEGESAFAPRAQADHSTPSDTRAWQEGDELKRVHWKLSMRRQSLMVHTYETPQQPDALVLIDLAPPPASGALRAATIDALTETCAGVLKDLLDRRRMARLPLSGDQAQELGGQDAQAFPAMRLALAHERFLRPCVFARLLYEATRRMRRVGSAAILTATLTSEVADAALALARTGPRVRVYFIAPAALTDEQAQLLHLLETSGLETEHVEV